MKQTNTLGHIVALAATAAMLTVVDDVDISNESAITTGGDGHVTRSIASTSTQQ